LRDPLPGDQCPTLEWPMVGLSSLEVLELLRGAAIHVEGRLSRWTLVIRAWILVIIGDQPDWAARLENQLLSTPIHMDLGHHTSKRISK
jgi:hypothetical protein